MNICVFCKNYGGFDCSSLRGQWHYHCGFEPALITPDEYKKRTDEDYPDECAVYIPARVYPSQYSHEVVTFCEAKRLNKLAIPEFMNYVYCTFPPVPPAEVSNDR